MNWKEQAESLWGYKWKSTFALTAGKTKRTVQRWNSGENKPDTVILDKLEKTHKIWKGDS